MTVREIKEQAAFQAEEARKIKDLADQETRGLTAEEALQFDKHMQESERLLKEAERQERLEKQEAILNQPQERVVTPEQANGKKIESATPKWFRFSKLQAFKGPTAEADAYKSGRWLMATIMDDAASRQWCHDHGVELRVQTEGINTAGGFIVPDEMERSIIDLRETYGMFRANAFIMPMSSDHMNIPRRASGVTAYFTGETDATTASDMAWNQVELTAKELSALTRMSASLSEDAIISVADIITRDMAWAFAKKEDECGLDGDGTSTYGGMYGIRARFVDGTHTAGQDAGTSPYTTWAGGTLADEITTLMSLLPTYAIPNAKWYIGPAGKAGLLDRIALEAGGNTTREIASGAQPMFAGYPIVVSAAMPTAPTNGTVAFLFGDLSLSTTLGDRRGITVTKSTERYFEYRQIAIQATERFCIVNHDIGDNTDAGPIVASVGTT